MSELRFYLLRIVACAFLVSALGSLVSQARLKRLVTLLGGCLLAVVALQPLITVDLAALPDYLYDVGLSDRYFSEQAEQQNRELLASLIQEQTEQRIADELAAQGIDANFVLELRYDEAVGAPVPWTIRLSSVCGEAEKQKLSAWLNEALGIPPERQEWHIG